MDKIVEELSRFGGFNKEQDELKEFYDSVKLRAEGIDNAEAKQKSLSLYMINSSLKDLKKLRNG